MRKLKLWRLTLIIALVISMLFTGCVASDENENTASDSDTVANTDNTTLVDAELYTVELINGKLYLEPKGGKERDPHWGTGCVIYYGITYDNIKQLRKKIFEGKLTEEDIEIAVNQFPRDENDMIPICDPNDFLVPKLSNDFRCTSATLTGELYALNYHSYSGKSSVRLSFISSEGFEIMKEQFGYMRSDYVPEKILPEKEYESYTYKVGENTYRDARYIIRGEDKELYVTEHYLLEVGPNTDISNFSTLISYTTPNRVNIFGIQHGQMIQLMMWNSAEAPVSDIINQFGLEKYSSQ